MQVFINKTKLAMRLGVDVRTVTARIESGEIRPDAFTDRKKPLFEKSKFKKA